LLGELTALPQIPWLDLRGSTPKGKAGRERKKGGEGKGLMGNVRGNGGEGKGVDI